MIVKHTTAEGRTVEAEVVEGTVRSSLRRASIMRREAIGIKDSDVEADELENAVIKNLLRLNAYPSCVACTVSFKDSDNPELDFGEFTFEEFLDVPDQFLTKWTAAAFELNPSWSESNVGPRMRPPSDNAPTK